MVLTELLILAKNQGKSTKNPEFSLFSGPKMVKYNREATGSVAWRSDPPFFLDIF